LQFSRSGFVARLVRFGLELASPGNSQTLSEKLAIDRREILSDFLGSRDICYVREHEGSDHGKRRAAKRQERGLARAAAVATSAPAHVAGKRAPHTGKYDIFREMFPNK
jgi:hypothetical protein